MPERLTPGPVRGNPCIKEAVCLHSRKVYDSCRDKECLQDLRVHLTVCSQDALERAVNVKPVSAQLIWVYVDVDAVPFNKGFFTVDAVFYYRVVAEAFCGPGKSALIEGVAAHSKRVILFGSEASVRSFNSNFDPDFDDIRRIAEAALPTAVVDAVEPIILAVKCVENSCVPCCEPCEATILPPEVARIFNDTIVFGPTCRTLFATIGQFSIIRLEREVQLLMPAFDDCIPEKECNNAAEEPCDVFERFRFPVEEFSPPGIFEAGPRMNC